MKFPSVSLQARFFIAPAIGVVLALTLCFFSISVIRSNVDTFEALKQSDFPHIAEVSAITVKLIENHSQFNNLLFAALLEPDEKRIEIEGREIVDQLHEIEQFFRSDFRQSKQPHDSLLANISMAYQSYQQAVVSALEVSMHDAKRAKLELIYANRYLKDLNQYLVQLSERHVESLNSSSNLIQKSVENASHLSFLAISLSILMIMLMVISAWASVRYVSQGLKKINGALMQLAEGRADVELPEFDDAYLRQNIVAVSSLQQTLLARSKAPAEEYAREPERVNFDLQTLLQDAVNSFATQAKNKNLSLDLDAKSELPRINGDPNSLQLILNYLISNAIKFTDSGGIRVVCDCDHVNYPTPLFNCAVTDTGIGLNPQKVTMLSEALGQKGIVKSSDQGVMELALVGQLCDSMGGKLRVTSEKGRGSCIQFQLPLKLLDAEQQLYSIAMPSADFLPQAQTQNLEPKI